MKGLEKMGMSEKCMFRLLMIETCHRGLAELAIGDAVFYLFLRRQNCACEQSYVDRGHI